MWIRVQALQTFRSKILLEVASFPLWDISQENRDKDVSFSLACGNHKSALENTSIIRDLLEEDVSRGFSLLLPISIVQHLPNISVSPLGCQQQDTINKQGKIIQKNHLTHDQSFPGPSGNSTNLWVDQGKLPPCQYGHCLRRIINYIASIRIRHPSTPIYLAKYNFDAAFLCCHMAPATALESFCSIDKLLLISLHLTFGGSPCPNIWETLGQPVCDPANELIQDSSWNHSELFDPLSDQLLLPHRLPPWHPILAGPSPSSQNSSRWQREGRYLHQWFHICLPRPTW